MALTTKASVQTSKCTNQPGKWCRRMVSGKKRVSRVEWWPGGTDAACFVLLRQSGCGEDTYQVSEKILPNKWISLTANNISSLVIDWLCDQAHSRDIAVSGLYCDYLAHEEQSTANMLGAILNQLLERDGIPKHVREAFRREKRGFGGRAIQLSGLVEILKTTITSLLKVFICIDGLDECLPKNRRELFESLLEIVRASSTTRVFLSGRPHIQDEVKGYFSAAIMISVIPTIGDIEKYLEMRLDRDTTPSAMDENLRAEIMRVIPRNISQM